MPDCYELQMRCAGCFLSFVVAGAGVEAFATLGWVPQAAGRRCRGSQLFIFMVGVICGVALPRCHGHMFVVSDGFWHLQTEICHRAYNLFIAFVAIHSGSCHDIPQCRAPMFAIIRLPLFLRPSLTRTCVSLSEMRPVLLCFVFDFTMCLGFGAVLLKGFGFTFVSMVVHWQIDNICVKTGPCSWPL